MRPNLGYSNWSWIKQQQLENRSNTEVQITETQTDSEEDLGDEQVEEYPEELISEELILEEEPVQKGTLEGTTVPFNATNISSVVIPSEATKLLTLNK